MTNWLANRLSEYDVMTMTGHASFGMTLGFNWLFVAIFSDRASKVNFAALKSDSVAKLLHVPAEV